MKCSSKANVATFALEFEEFNDCNVNHMQRQEEEGVPTVTPPNEDVSTPIKSPQVKENRIWEMYCQSHHVCNPRKRRVSLL